MTSAAIYKGYAETFRFQLAGEQNWRCCYCGVAMNRFRNVPTLCTTEHVIPKACGGQLRWETCAAACKKCNNERGHAILEMIRLPINLPFCSRCGWLLRDTRRAMRCDECRTNFSHDTAATRLPLSDIRFHALIRVAGDMLVSTTERRWLANTLCVEVLKTNYCGNLCDAIIGVVSDPVEAARRVFPDDPIEAYRRVEADLLERYTLKTVNPPRGGFPETNVSKQTPSSDISSFRSVRSSRHGGIAVTRKSVFGKAETRQAEKFAMRAFSCPVARIGHVSPIPGADAIEHAKVFGCDVIVPQGRYSVGDLAVYVPPDAVLPDRLAESLRGSVKLFGERRNRTRPYRLRNALSEGILIGPLSGGIEGADAAQVLGITKYEPPVPKAWRGDCIHLPGLTISYDIESARRYHRVLHEGEPVELTEKLHGTLCAVGYVPRLAHADLIEGDTLVYSKGLARTGHALKASNTENLYISTAIDGLLRDRIKHAFNGRPATIFGEIFGPGIQDLDYNRKTPEFALFDIYLGRPGQGHWLSRDEVAHISGEIAPSVPLIHRGPLESDLIRRIASKRSVAAYGTHLSEGVVIRPLRERVNPRIGRVILKYVSPEYLHRANGTEFN